MVISHLNNNAAPPILSEPGSAVAEGVHPIWIRTTGTAAQKPWISGAFRALRGIGGLVNDTTGWFSPCSSAPRTTPSSQAGARFEQVVACWAARRLSPAGGTTHIDLRPASARPAIR